nr:sugar transferase [Paraburkholderia sp. XV]
MSNVILAIEASGWLVAIFGSALAISVVVNYLRHSSQAAKQLALARFALEADADEVDTLETSRGQEIVGEHLLVAARKIQRRDWAKRAFDFTAAVFFMVALLPLLVIISLVIISDGGPALYGHVRVGRNGKPFRCLKFRSMVVNADQVFQSQIGSDPLARAEWELSFKLEHDMRVTRIGRFLRRTSLDELPQLWNVVRGDMSLVGPRPLVESELQRYGSTASYYLTFRPGMTGLWQASGQETADYAKQPELIAAYVKEGSLLQDVHIPWQRSREFFSNTLHA